MSELFGDTRHDKRRKHRIFVRCGSCRDRAGTIELAASGLRRCPQCFAAMGLEERHARSIAPQPEIAGTRIVPASQPTVVRGSTSVEDFKIRASGDAAT
jgi:hypothetical protein